ncbi:hypothetical protein Glove_357g28 [Diversispora epigaea]|uniref:Uncharacterized protein n=1 Tax=Diversispora epigaea TaxID=1348612 RepID=A0A397HBP7_9GLOM|nr:hypothetical protein Glove_357g28 [Diversispora epigaea]
MCIFGSLTKVPGPKLIALKTHLLPFYNTAHELIGGKLAFQHDNSPIHTAKKPQNDKLKTALSEEWSKFDVSILKKFKMCIFGSLTKVPGPKLIALKTHLLPFYNTAHELIGGKLAFQHDNSPIHTAKKPQNDKLKTALSEEWSKFDVSILKKVMDTVHKELKQALARNDK